MWLLVVFFSETQDKFDIVPVCALARVSFTYLHTTIYTPLRVSTGGNVIASVRLSVRVHSVTGMSPLSGGT